jgi:hypothetical protein
VKKSRAEGQRLAEAIEINSSLMVLGRVIDALVALRPHVPCVQRLKYNPPPSSCRALRLVWACKKAP